MTRSYSVTFGHHGVPATSMPSRWSISAGDVSAFVRKYRTAPDHTVITPEIRSAFGEFLMPPSLPRDAVVDAMKQRAVLSIRADDDAAPLLLGLPWELAAHPDPDPSRKALSGTLAGEPVQRVIAGTLAREAEDDQRPRLRALAYIPPAAVTGGIGFHFDVARALGERSGFLDSTFVESEDHAPSFAEFAERAEAVKPDLVVIVTHGRISNGRAELQFEKWQPIAKLATELTFHRVPALMLLIACDQAVLPEVPNAESGASTLIRAGVPYVVAMQSSVKTRLAADFLGTFIDHFFANGSVPHAVAAGRRQMVPPAVVEQNIDWSFPVVVTSDNGAEKARPLLAAMSAFTRTLELLARRVPAPLHRYVSRPAVETVVKNVISGEVSGVQIVAGEQGTGVSEVIRHVVTETILRMIDLRTTTARPVVYIDLETHPEPLDSAVRIGTMLASEVTSVRSRESTPLLTIPPARGRDGTLTMEPSYDKIIASLDANRCVVVLDNVHEEAPELQTFIEESKRLRFSLVIVATRPYLFGPADMEIPRMTPEETSELARVFDPYADGAAIYERTGGLVGAILTGSLTPAEATLFDKLTLLPHGVSAPIAWEFLAPWTEVAALERKGLLRRRYLQAPRRNYVMVVPASIRAAALADARKDHEANEDDFGDDVFEKVLAVAEPQLRLRQIAAATEGVGFVIDFQAILIRRSRIAEAIALATLLHEWLFERALWHAAYVLWSQPLAAEPFKDAHLWLKIAKTSHILGSNTEALAQIREAELREMTPLDQVDANMLHALIIKDSGDTTQAPKAKARYELAFEILATIEPNEGLTVQEIEERRALLHYNRSLLRRYWIGDVDGALADLSTARELYQRYNNSVMLALTLTERADVQIAGQQRDSFPQIIDSLHEADHLFEGASNLGDRAFCNYQMARAYLRLPATTPEERRLNQRKALDAVRNAERLASEAGDDRQKSIAALRRVTLSHTLGEMTSEAMFEEIQSILRVRDVFANDFWFRRASRDTLLGCVAILEGDARCAAAQLAWSIVAGWRHYSPRVDKGPTALAFVSFLECVEKNEGALAAEQLVRDADDDLKSILGRTADPLTIAAWLPELQQMATAMGGLWYGQSARQ